MPARKEPQMIFPDKHRFCGFYKMGYPWKEGEIETILIEASDILTIGTPVLGFLDAKVEASYITDELPRDETDKYIWSQSLKNKFTEERENSISMIFSGLNTPDEYFMFAKQFGRLLGFEDNFVGNTLIEAIGEEESLLECFNQKLDKRKLDSTRFSLRNISTTSPVWFEELTDWRLASQLMRMAYLLYKLQEGSYAVKSDDHRLFFESEEDDKTVFSLFTSDKEWYVLPLFGLNDKETYIRDGNNYLSRCIAADRTHAHEGIAHFLSGFEVRLSSSSFGWPEMRIRSTKLSPDDSSTECAIHLVKKVLDYLVAIHKVDMSFFLHDGYPYYAFDSLLSYLWYDFQLTVTGSKSYSICRYCGKPMFTDNSGKKKKSCSALCRRKAKGDRDKRRKQEAEKESAK